MAYATESKEGDKAAFTTDAPAPVRVVCRIRPSLYGGRVSAAAVKGEDGEDAVELYQTNKNTIQRAKVKGEAPRSTTFVSRKQWVLDGVYGPEVDTMKMYIDEMSNRVDHVLMLGGRSACILAFGQTGSGKTHTISGDPKNAGIAQLAAVHLADGIEDINSTVEREEDLLQMFVSGGEVYQEQLLDLGVECETSSVVKPRRLTPATLTRVPVGSADELIRTIEIMISRRASGATNKNEHSSRSHAVYSVAIERRGEPMVPVGLLGLADLAGAEYAAATEGCDAARRMEGGKNNLGLMTLKAAFRHVSESAVKPGMLPFSWHRSALTRILKPFLSGTEVDNSLLLLVTISPESQDITQTVQALTDAVALIGRTGAEKEVIDLGDMSGASSGVILVPADGAPAPVAAKGGPGRGPAPTTLASSSSYSRLAAPRKMQSPPNKRPILRAGSGIAGGKKVSTPIASEVSRPTSRATART